MKRLLVCLPLLLIPLHMCLGHWNPETDEPKMHWPQPPNATTNGVDVSMSDTSGGLSLWLADDFRCTQSGPITGIHFWVSFQGDLIQDTPGFSVQIWSDDPGDPQRHSQPSNLLWATELQPADLHFDFWSEVPDGEWWYNPALPELIPAGDTQIYEVNMSFAPELAFNQTTGTVYWLALHAQGFDPLQQQVGWKTTAPENHWNDDAVWSAGDGTWNELTYPAGHPYHELPYPQNSIDLSFVITGMAEEEPPEYPHVKWYQPLDTEHGFDIPSFVSEGGEEFVADDFVSDGRPIAGLRFWGSYQDWQSTEEGPVLPPTGNYAPSKFRFYWLTDSPAGESAEYSTPKDPLRVDTYPASAVSTAYCTSIWHQVESGGYWEHEYVYELMFTNTWNEKEGTVYWLGIQAVYEPTADPLYVWGWATTPLEHNWNDDAVRQTPKAGETNLYEAFEAWPAGWTVVNNGGDCVWQLGSADGGTGAEPNVDTNYTGGTGDYADADADNCGDGTTMDTELWTPSMDFSSLVAPRLSFASDMRDTGYRDTFEVDYSIDGGSSWHNLLSRTNASYRGPETIELDLIEAAGEPSVIVRFHYMAPGWDWWWQVDDVTVTEFPYIDLYYDEVYMGHPYGDASVNMAFALISDVAGRRARKWDQPPDMDMGENMPSFVDPSQPLLATLRAEDFISDGRRITDIHWWGSYLGYMTNVPGPVPGPTDYHDRPEGFYLSWHQDIPDPDGSGPEYSMPGELLTNVFVPFEFCHEVYFGTVTQVWKNPEYYEHEFQYYVDLLNTNVAGLGPWYEQAGTTYWLNVQAVMRVDWQREMHQGWGWKTTPPEHHWNDFSVISYDNGVTWDRGIYPMGHPYEIEPGCDLAFELTTDEVGTNRYYTPIVITNMTGVDTNAHILLQSVGDWGSGKQYLEFCTDLMATNWQTLMVKPFPYPAPWVNTWYWTNAVHSNEFYRIKQK